MRLRARRRIAVLKVPDAPALQGPKAVNAGSVDELASLIRTQARKIALVGVDV